MATRLINKLFFLILLWIVKVIGSLISGFHLGQASNFPGKVALSIKKDLLQYFKINEDCKITLITGTNGKSTTCGMLTNILKAEHKNVICNKSGANLLSGIVTTLCHYSNLLGKLKYDYIVLEVDEATLPLLTAKIKVNLIAVTNFFRDQLDRFGELDTTVKLIENGLNNIKNNNKDTAIVLNADDPRVAFLNITNQKIYYGLGRSEATLHPYNISNNNTDWLSDPEETTTCPKCKSTFIFTQTFLAHLGDYKCSKCNLKRPSIDFLIPDFKIDNMSTNFDLIHKDHKNNFFFPMIGIFNLYNALCAIAIAKTISNPTPVQIQKGFQSYSTIFGRGEKITINNKSAWVYLIKNPTGTTEVLKTLTKVNNARFLIAINDNFADGRDVSWLWDTRFDILSNHKKEIYVSGKRAFDIALRLKYANVRPENIKVAENIASAINTAAKSLEQNETLYILPTYTVLLELQKKKICKGAPL